MPLAATTYYFTSREQLVAEALRMTVDDELTEVEAWLAQAPQATTPAQAADQLAELFETTLAGDRLGLLARNELYQAAARTPELQLQARRWTDAYLDLLTPVLERLGARKPRADAEIVVAALDGLLDFRLSEGRCSPQELRDRLRRLLEALCAPAAARSRH